MNLARKSAVEAMNVNSKEYSIVKSTICKQKQGVQVNRTKKDKVTWQEIQEIKGKVCIKKNYEKSLCL